MLQKTKILKAFQLAKTFVSILCCNLSNVVCCVNQASKT